MTTIDKPHHDASAPDPQAAAPATAQVYGVLAEFEDVDGLLHAAVGVRDRGFTRWDCFTPFPVHGLNKAMGMRPTVLPYLVLAGGIGGMIGGMMLQLYSMATTIDGLPAWIQGYQYLIGGKPFASIPAFIPVSFETTILASAFTTFLGMLLLNGLPRLYHPLFKSARFARATDDRFFIAIECRDPMFDTQKTVELLRTLGAVHVEELAA